MFKYRPVSLPIKGSPFHSKFESILDDLVALILLVERNSYFLFYRIDIFLQFLQEHVLKHANNALKVDLN